MKKIKKAITRNEMHLFLIGESEYQCHGYSDDPEPNDYLACWGQEIIPYSRTRQGKNLGSEIVKGFNDVLEHTTDRHLAIYTVMCHFNGLLVQKEPVLNRKL